MCATRQWSLYPIYLLPFPQKACLDYTHKSSLILFSSYPTPPLPLSFELSLSRPSLLIPCFCSLLTFVSHHVVHIAQCVSFSTTTKYTHTTTTAIPFAIQQQSSCRPHSYWERLYWNFEADRLGNILFVLRALALCWSQLIIANRTHMDETNGFCSTRLFRATHTYTCHLCCQQTILLGNIIMW